MAGYVPMPGEPAYVSWSCQQCEDTGQIHHESGDSGAWMEICSCEAGDQRRMASPPLWDADEDPEPDYDQEYTARKQEAASEFVSLWTFRVDLGE